MASPSSSKPENNDGNEAPQWPSEGFTGDEVDGVPLSVHEFLRDNDAADMSDEQSGLMYSFSQHSANLLDQTPMLPMMDPFGVFPSPSTLSEVFLTDSGVFPSRSMVSEVDPADVDPHAAAFADSVTVTQPPPSPPLAIEGVPTQIGYSEAMTSVRPLGTQHYYVPDPPTHLIPPPPPLHSSPSVPLSPPTQPITCSQSIQQSIMTSITVDPSLSQPPSQSQTTTTSLSPPSPTPLPSPNQTLTSPSHHTIPSSSPLPQPSPFDQNQTIASPPQLLDQTATSTPLPPPPSPQLAKSKVISPLPPLPSTPSSTTATTMSPPPVSHPTTTLTIGAQRSPSAAAESTGEMPTKRKRGRPRKEFVGERSRSGVEGRVDEASQEKKKKSTQGEGEGEDKQPAPSFAAPSASPSPSVLFNHPNSTVLGFSSCRNVIRPASIIASQNEDISAKIVSFALNNGAVFVLAASGQLSSLCYMEPSGIVQELTGVYEILSLSGTLLLSSGGEALAQRSRTGYLTISVVGMDGKIIGGRVCGSMIAASPVQVVGGAIVAAASDGKDSASSKDSSLLLELNQQINSLSQEWQARLLDTKTKAIERVESAKKELRQAKQEIEETRQLLNQTRQELQETRLSVSTNQNLLMQLFERLNIVNPPPPPQ